jgi:hypothetical protein
MLIPGIGEEIEIEGSSIIVEGELKMTEEFGFENLEVYKKSTKYVEKVYKVTKDLEDFTKRRRSNSIILPEDQFMNQFQY